MNTLQPSERPQHSTSNLSNITSKFLNPQVLAVVAAVSVSLAAAISGCKSEVIVPGNSAGASSGTDGSGGSSFDGGLGGSGGIAFDGGFGGNGGGTVDGGPGLYEGFCIISDNFSPFPLPSYNDPDIGPGYVKINMPGPFSSLNELDGACNKENFNTLEMNFCTTNPKGTKGQHEIALFTITDDIEKALTCSTVTGCDDYICP